MPSTLARLLDDDATAFRTHCRYSDRVGWPQAQCVASLRQGAATLLAPSHGCPARLHEAFGSGSSFGWTGPATNAMLCRDDGRYTMPGSTRVLHGEFNHSSALTVKQSTCMSFRFGRAKAAKQERQVHAGPALLGADYDLGHVLSAGRAGRFALMNMGMNYTKRKLDGLWTPCTNVAFVSCALRGWLPGQGGKPLFYIATPGRSLMRKCRPCAGCEPNLFWDECYIVRSEYCMLDSYCANGHEIWNMTPGNWTCVPRRRQQLAARAVKRRR